MQKAKEMHDYRVFGYPGNFFAREKYSKGEKMQYKRLWQQFREKSS